MFSRENSNVSIGKKGVTTNEEEAADIQCWLSPPQMFPFELLSMADRTVNSKGLLTYLAAKTRRDLECSMCACCVRVAKTDQGEQIKGWSGSSEYNSMFVC